MSIVLFKKRRVWLWRHLRENDTYVCMMPFHRKRDVYVCDAIWKETCVFVMLFKWKRDVYICDAISLEKRCTRLECYLKRDVCVYNALEKETCISVRLFKWKRDVSVHDVSMTPFKSGGDSYVCGTMGLEKRRKILRCNLKRDIYVCDVIQVEHRRVSLWCHSNPSSSSRFPVFLQKNETRVCIMRFGKRRVCL